MSVEAVKLTETTGSEVRGEVSSLLKPENAAAIRQLLTERGVLVFRQLNILDEDQVRLAGMIGTLRDEGEGHVFKVTIDPGENAKADYLRGSFLWHMDGTHDTVPAFASLLSGRQLSAQGGDTLFANSYAAYGALPRAMQERIADLRVVHSFATSMENAGIARTPANEAYWNSIPEQTHALVWTHESGRKSLVIGCHAKSVVGLDKAESDALIAELLAWVTQDRFVYRHKWTVGDMLIWDNTGVLHRAEPYAADSGRMMHRTTLLGEEAFS
ncbi:MAG: TauD/TfdA family dioxygenase [Novosphingobium sp.]